MSNSNAYMNAYMKARYFRRRAEWIVKLGGKCVDCETTENLEFDHRIAAEKSFNIADALSGWSEKRIAPEMEKCVLRCRKCHFKKTIAFDIHSVPHGGGVSGKWNCKCDLCKTQKNAYMRRWKRNKRLRLKLEGQVGIEPTEDTG